MPAAELCMPEQMEGLALRVREEDKRTSQMVFTPQQWSETAWKARLGLGDSLANFAGKTRTPSSTTPLR